MKNVLSSTKALIILLVVTVLFLGFYTYMLARPISYGMNYNNEVVYEGNAFKGTLKYHIGGEVTSKNSNFKEEMTLYYYNKGGYVFHLMAQTEEEYKEEVDYIKDNFDEAVDTPFYASKTNVFRQVAVGMDEDVTTYTCTGAIVFAIVGGAVALALATLTAFAFILSKKNKV